MVSVHPIFNAESRRTDMLQPQNQPNLCIADIQLTRFVEQAPFGIGLFDDSMQCVAASVRFVAQHGATGADDLPSGDGRQVLRLPSEWIQRMPMVLAGEPLAGTGDAVQMPRGERAYFDWSMTPWQHPGGGVAGFVLLSEEVTQRVRANQDQAFRLALTERLRDLSDPVAMMEVATELLGRQLDIAQVGFAEIEADQAHIQVRRDWNDGRIPSVVGRWRMDDFGPAFIQEMKQGRTIVIRDIEHDPRTSSAKVVEAYRSISTRAILDRACIRDGHMVAMLFIHHSEPRHWRPDEIMLVEEVTERLWAAVERARSYALLRESEAQFRELVENINQLTWTADLEGNLTWANKRWQEYTGASSQAVSGWHWMELHHPDHVERVAASFRQALARGEPWEDTVPLRSRDGQYRWFLSRAAPIRNVYGQIMRWFCTHTLVA